VADFFEDVDILKEKVDYDLNQQVIQIIDKKVESLNVN
jgi:hypothetical protein